MNRRGFLGRLAAALATATVARKLPAAEVEAPVERDPYSPRDIVIDDIIRVDRAVPGCDWTACHVVSSPEWAPANIVDDRLVMTPALSSLAAGHYRGSVGIALPPGLSTTIPVTFNVSGPPKRKRRRRRDRR